MPVASFKGSAESMVGDAGVSVGRGAGVSSLSQPLINSIDRQAISVVPCNSLLEIRDSV